MQSSPYSQLVWSSPEPGVELAAVQRPAAPEPPVEAALVAAARTSPQAFGLLYERYVGPIYRYCYARLASREAAEDATGEVFLKALAGLPGYRGGVFPAWLFRIVRNAVSEAHRRRSPSGPLEAADDQMDPNVMPEDVAARRAECAALHLALARLPGEQSTVIELQVAGWSGEQIAGVLGKSPAAVKMLRFRAMAQLRALLADRGEIEETHHA